MPYEQVHIAIPGKTWDDLEIGLKNQLPAILDSFERYLATYPSFREKATCLYFVVDKLSDRIFFELAGVALGRFAVLHVEAIPEFVKTIPYEEDPDRADVMEDELMQLVGEAISKAMRSTEVDEFMKAAVVKQGIVAKICEYDTRGKESQAFPHQQVYPT